MLGLCAFYFPVERRILAVRLLRAMASEDRSRPPEPGVPIHDLKMPDGTPIEARVYGPPPSDARLTIILAHGIHHKGIEEPRLIRFARHLERLGCRVLTPELSELANYHIAENGVITISESIAYAAREGAPVGVIGFSFAGGLSLLAATDPAVAAQLRYVASIGGYHDLHRSLRFLATHQVESPENKSHARHAHEYGLLVLLYGHLSEFELGADEAVFRSALLSWLKEDRPTSRRYAAQLTTPKGKHLYSLVEKQDGSKLAPKVLRFLDKRKDELDRLSPRGRLASIQTELLFLHGSGDSVVPPEETRFAQLELERSDHPEFRTLVTPLLEHVRVENKSGYQEEWALIQIMARLF